MPLRGTEIGDIYISSGLDGSSNPTWELVKHVESMDVSPTTKAVVPMHTRGAGHMTTRASKKKSFGAITLNLAMFDYEEPSHAFLYDAFEVGLNEETFPDQEFLVKEEDPDTNEGEIYKVYITGHGPTNLTRDDGMVGHTFALQQNAEVEIQEAT